jgi:hypothetical protein
MKTTILFAVLLVSATFAKPQPGLPFLLIWPTARSTALAGAMTGLADDPDAAFYNSAGLAFQSGTSATASYAEWLPGLYPGMDYAFAAGNVKLSERACVGLNATWIHLGRYDFWWYDPPYDRGPREVWRGALACNAAVRLSDHVALGGAAKFIHSYLVPEWIWESMPEVGADDGSTGNTLAADIGALWKPSSRLSLGGNVANLGPGIGYPDQNEHSPSPTILRVGACWTPVSNEYVRINVLPEFDKLLVGMFFDTAGTETFGHELQTELRDAWKSLGVEVTGLEFVTLRLGYFEDISWQRGGIVFERDRGEYHHNVYDLLTRRNLGEFKSIGLCWGFGIGYKDYFRLDVSSDAAIYDFDTSNWKLSLVANDIVGGLREIRQGHRPR